MSHKTKKVKVKIKANDNKEYECKICGEMHTDYPNNGQPVVDGPVCKHCNERHIIPARLKGSKSHDAVNIDVKALKKEIKELDAQIKVAVKENNTAEFTALSNKRNNLMRKIMKFNNKANDSYDDNTDFLEDITAEVAELLPDIEYEDIKDEVMSMYQGESEEDLKAMFETEEDYAAQIDGLVSRFDNKAEDSANYQTNIEINEYLASILSQKMEFIEDSKVRFSVEGKESKITYDAFIEDVFDEFIDTYEFEENPDNMMFESHDEYLTYLIKEITTGK